MKIAIKRKGNKFSIDVLECQRQIKAGTLSAEDRALLNRVLPGVVESIPIPGMVTDHGVRASAPPKGGAR